MHVMTVLGARPQFIKAAAVSAAFAREESVRETLLHTGQHFDANMSDVFFRELGIPAPAFHLGIHGGAHGAMTGRMLEGVEDVLVAVRPDLVLVYGDTNSTLAGALAAVKLHIPVAHVEAGLRSFNRRMPEEINRILTDHMAGMLFAPTELAVRNLEAEGIAGNAVHLVGDVMYDAVMLFNGLARRQSDILARLDLEGRPYVLCTVHRAESTGDIGLLRNIFSALRHVAEEIPVVLPLHPRTRSVLDEAGMGIDPHPNLRVTEPVGYLDMLRLEAAATVIVTDSGGIQKEAFFHRVPCVTLREQTEWSELLDLGWNRLASTRDPDAIVSAIWGAVGTAGQDGDFYGTGDAAQRIVHAIRSA